MTDQSVITELGPVTQGTVTKLVRTHGSRWGRVRSLPGSVDSFFNEASMTRPAEFDDLAEGDAVAYVQEVDRVNGFRARQLVATEAQPAPAPSQPSMP
jgi:cold shock CspA family protein